MPACRAYKIQIECEIVLRGNHGAEHLSGNEKVPQICL